MFMAEANNTLLTIAKAHGWHVQPTCVNATHYVFDQRLVVYGYDGIIQIPMHSLNKAIDTIIPRKLIINGHMILVYKQIGVVYNNHYIYGQMINEALSEYAKLNSNQPKMFFIRSNYEHIEELLWWLVRLSYTGYDYIHKHLLHKTDRVLTINNNYKHIYNISVDDVTYSLGTMVELTGTVDEIIATLCAGIVIGDFLIKRNLIVYKGFAIDTKMVSDFRDIWE